MIPSGDGSTALPEILNPSSVSDLYYADRPAPDLCL
jgi:hypothetical protein